MSFTDQKPRIATKEDRQSIWSGGRRGENFRCYLCGHKFKEGDYWRWQYCYGRFAKIDGKKIGLINFLVCKGCDGDDVLDRWVKNIEELYQRFWWVCDDIY